MSTAFARNQLGLIADDLIFDVGLHRGEDTAYYLAKGYRVVAFEADPTSVAFCKERFRNEIASKQLRIVEGAIAEDARRETITFYVNKSKSVWSTTSTDWMEGKKRWRSKTTAIVVSRVDILKMFLEFGTPYYLKIDVEGADRHVLRTVAMLPGRPRYLSFESEKVSFKSLLADLELVQSLGYERFKVVQQATIPGRTVKVSDRFGTEFVYQFERHASGDFGEEAEGRWVTKQEAIDIYREIFASYRRLGEGSFIGRHFSLPLRATRRILRRGLPGWHDLHAALG
jgi:FkbM family methyltransferase